MSDDSTSKTTNEPIQVNTDYKQLLSEFVASTPRLLRYRLAKKKLRFRVYASMELFVALHGLLLLITFYNKSRSLSEYLFISSFLVLIVGVGHYGRIASDQPWLPARALVESIIVFFTVRYFVDAERLPDLWAACTLLFIWRFWERAERMTNVYALANHIEMNAGQSKE